MVNRKQVPTPAAEVSIRVEEAEHNASPLESATDLNRTIWHSTQLVLKNVWQADLPGRGACCAKCAEHLL